MYCKIECSKANYEAQKSTTGTEYCKCKNGYYETETTDKKSKYCKLDCAKVGPFMTEVSGKCVCK